MATLASNMQRLNEVTIREIELDHGRVNVKLPGGVTLHFGSLEDLREFAAGADPDELLRGVLQVILDEDPALEHAESIRSYTYDRVAPQRREEL